MTTSNRGNDSSSANGEFEDFEIVMNPNESAGRVPREDFTDTITGQQLAGIIDELYRQREEIERSDTFSLSSESDRAVSTLIDRAGDAGPVPDVDAPEPLVEGIIQDIGMKLNQYLKQRIANHHEMLTSKLREHAAQIERTAQEKVKAHADQIREHYEAEFAAKEKKLREDYDRLTELANKLAQQKAEIQRSRRNLAQALQTANKVNQAVFRAGNQLLAQVDDLAEMGSDEGAG